VYQAALRFVPVIIPYNHHNSLHILCCTQPVIKHPMKKVLKRLKKSAAHRWEIGRKNINYGFYFVRKFYEKKILETCFHYMIRAVTLFINPMSLFSTK
jgi:hypothetical protein